MKPMLVVLLFFVTTFLIYTITITKSSQTKKDYQQYKIHQQPTTFAHKTTPPTIKDISEYVSDFNNTIRIGTVLDYFRRSWLGEALETTNPVPFCSIQCYFDSRQIVDDNVDAVLFFSTDSQTMSNFQNKILITHTLEFPPSKLHWKNILREDFGRIFQIAIQYYLPTDETVLKGWENAVKYNRTILYIPVTAAWFSESEILQNPIPFEQKLNKTVLFISNCGSEERNQYVEKLLNIMGHQMDSYGSCWPYNSEDDVELCKNIKNKYSKKMCIMAQYKFSLSFENTMDESYVTEKYFQGAYQVYLNNKKALKVGSVPVVWGAPNINKFDPLYNTNYPYKSYIHANIQTPENLAEQLNILMNNKTLYEEYLKWKIVGIGDHFKELLSLRSTHDGVCNMCKAVAYIKKMESLHKNKI